MKAEDVTEDIVAKIGERLAEDAAAGMPWAQEYHARLEAATAHEEKAIILAELYNDYIVPTINAFFERINAILPDPRARDMAMLNSFSDRPREATQHSEEETDAENTAQG